MSAPEPRKILVIQLRRIGDVILTTPAVAALAKRFPGAQIDFLVEPAGAEALIGNPHIRAVHVYRPQGLFGTLRWWRRVRALGYDWVIDYLGTPRSAFIAFFSGAVVRAGYSHVGHRWAYNRLFTRPKAARYVAQEKIEVLKDLGVPGSGADFLPKIYLAPRSSRPKNLIGLVPASRKVTRRWPAASYAALGRLLRDKYGSELLVFWGPGERALAEEVVRGIGAGARLSPETPDLRSMAALMADCRAVVTNCNGPKHLAVALGVPTLTIHGSSDPAAWNPPHPRHLVARLDDLFCIGCRLNACPYQLECMTQLSPERVFAAAERLLDAEVRA